MKIQSAKWYFLHIFILITEKPFEYTILKICQIRKISSHASYTSTERGTTSSDYHVTEYHAGVLRILINFLEQYFESFSHVYVATFMAGLCFLLGFLEFSMQAILDSETQHTPVRNVVCGCSTGTSQGVTGRFVLLFGILIHFYPDLHPFVLLELPEGFYRI